MENKFRKLESTIKYFLKTIPNELALEMYMSSAANAKFFFGEGIVGYTYVSRIVTACDFTIDNRGYNAIILKDNKPKSFLIKVSSLSKPITTLNTRDLASLRAGSELTVVRNVH